MSDVNPTRGGARGPDRGPNRLPVPELEEPAGATSGGDRVSDPAAAGTRDPMAAEATSGRSASLWSDAWRQLRRNPVFVIAAILLVVLTVMSLFPQLFTNADPRSCNLRLSRQSPSAEAWFGYDLQGCDYYSNVIYGARVSMAIGIIVVGGSLVIGVVLGALAGYYGGWLDSLIARLTDIAYGIPFILGAILILQAFPQGGRGLFHVSLALIVLGWMTILRLFRSNVISIKNSDYVSAARAQGGNDWRIMTKHILPNAIAPVLVYATIAVGGIIAAEATLSFLGVGLQLPAISWGLQIDQSRGFIRTSPHLLLFPSAFLSVTVLCFIMLGDALRDALDPKLR
jgi:oligopeptide transport system permease protein